MAAGQGAENQPGPRWVWSPTMVRARRFDEALGWRASALVKGGTSSRGGDDHSLYGRAELAAEDEDLAGRGFGGSAAIMLADNYRTGRCRPAIWRRARPTAATILSLLMKLWGGYVGYLADPDGHPWEVAWNTPLSAVRTTAARLPV